MKKTAQSNATTQQFSEIQDIRESIVLLNGGNACLVIRVTSVNLALLSPEEQDAKVQAYASLLNSLSFPVQIFIQSKQVQITPYLNSLDSAAINTKNEKLAESIKLYKAFVENLVKMTTVLDKQFFMVIPYSSLEGGIKSAAIGAGKLDDFFIQAKAALKTKAESLSSQLDRLSLRAKVLDKEELVMLYYGLFNQSDSLRLLDVQSMLAQTGGTQK